MNFYTVHAIIWRSLAEIFATAEYFPRPFQKRTSSFLPFSLTLFVDLFVVCLFPVHKTENVEGHCGSIRHWSFLEWSLYVEEALRQKFTAL